MRISRTGWMVALGVALVVAFQRDRIQHFILPDPDAATVVDNLPFSLRESFLVNQTQECIVQLRAQGGFSPAPAAFCGCQIARFSSFMTRREIVTRRFDGVQRYIDFSLLQRRIEGDCQRSASATVVQTEI